MLTGSVLASLGAGFIGTRYGRRVGLLACGLTGLVGPILQASSTHIATMYIGRLISGGKKILLFISTLDSIGKY